MKNYKLKSTANGLIVLFITFVQLANVGYSQKDTDILANIGALKIIVEEFKNRYEFMPHLNYSSDNRDTVKKEFLYSLIAEKLWALEGSQKRFDTLESVKYSLESLRRLLIRDELYKTEVEPKIKISNEEFNIGLQRVTLELFVNIISTEDSSEIFRISDQLIKGADFDSLLSTRKEKNLQQSPIRIVFGSVDDEAVEDLLFGMNPGGISLPIKSGDGWFIFKLVNQSNNPAVNLSTEQPRNMVKKTLTDRKIKQVGGAYLDSLIGGKSIEADGKIFLKIFDALYSVIRTEYPTNLSDSLFKVTLSERQIIQAMQLADPSILGSVFIKFEDGTASVKDFFYYLYYRGLELNNLSQIHIKKILNSNVRQFIEDEMLVREGIKRGLANRRDVTDGISMWREHYTAKLMMESFYDSVLVDKKELDEYINQNNIKIDSLHNEHFYKSQIKLRKLDEIILRKTIEYAKQYSFDINEQILDNIKLSELNTFTYKLIGFGGRIAAFPITIPMYEWYYQMKSEKTSLP